MLVFLVSALLLGGPPKLPPLPTRGMPAPPSSEPDEGPATNDPATDQPSSDSSAQPPATQPKPTPAPPEPKRPADDQPAFKPPPAQPPPKPKPVQLHSPPKTKTQAQRTAVQPLPPASDAELAALAAGPPRGSSKPPASKRKGPPAGDMAVVRTATEEPDSKPLTFRRRPHPPKKSAAFVFGYRQFQLTDALQRQQSWHFASVEVTPLRRYFRLNLLTEIGLEGGEAARAGDRSDIMLIQKVGLGVQYPHWVTPFAEFQAGIGGARIELFERNDLLLLYTLGVDVGAQWAVTRWLFVHGAVGWIRPVMRQPTGYVRYDRFAFKVGIGF